jgi:hypothetical protein
VFANSTRWLVLSPPEELKAVNTTATEEPSANEEARKQSPPPPVDAPNDEIPVAGSTSVPDHDLEATQDTPSEDQTSMVAETLNNGGTTEPPVDDHVHMSEAAPEDEPVAPITDTEPLAPAPEPELEEPPAAEPHEIKEAEQPLTVLPDDSPAIPEGVSQPEQDESAAPEVVESTPPAVAESSVAEVDALDTAQPEADAPLPVDLEGDAIHLENAASTEPDVAAVQEDTQ